MMARVAAVLHQPLTVLEGMELDELLAWDQEARRLAGELAALRGF